MKQINIKFVGRFRVSHKKYILDTLQKRYKVVISDSPDYIFYSVYDFTFLKYDCVRLFFTEECYTPNFNECDYAIGFDRMTMGDRYARMPLYALFQYKKFFEMIKNRKKFTMEDLKQKKGFCNFVVSNCFAHEARSIMFEKLCEYKKVDSGGRYKNNVGGPIKDKFEFQKGYKFSLAFENCSYAGYCTEKIVEAFAAGTIPIYYGDPDVVKDFNPKAFVNVHDYNSLEEVVARVKEIDANDELWLQMMNEPIVKEDADIADFDTFLYSIFDQPIEDAYRRPKDSLTAKAHDKMLSRHRLFEDKIYRYIRKSNNLIKRIKMDSL